MLRPIANHDKKNKLSGHVAKEFNKLLAQIRIELPAIADQVPQDIPMSFEKLDRGSGNSAITFLDFELLAEQVITLLDLQKK